MEEKINGTTKTCAADTWEARDVAHIWHPAAQMKDYEELPPIVVDRAKGVWLYDVYGKKYLDVISSWWCNLFGHCNPIVSDAVKAQLDKLEHVIFANFSHEPAIRLAEALAEIVPKGLTKFHFNDNGSSAVEAALKMAFQYHIQTGAPKRQKFM
ncbi:MAG: aminotransferase class III-fold pyridoxal phosphate-dependent enzyme, partial [Oscillospiraceae bacterium]|nr:aminotransferase class III-fold pyridoxal phosphate-dependent enzyme [Oscillospiraceae bacterium]